ncbi:unnamed protein product, partial [marine sediment metagenome]
MDIYLVNVKKHDDNTFIFKNNNTPNKPGISISISKDDNKQEISKDKDGEISDDKELEISKDKELEISKDKDGEISKDKDGEIIKD